MTNQNGWIKIHRKFLEWEWYSHPVASRLFIHLLILTNHADKKWQGIIIKRGEVLTGRKKLAYQLGVSEQSIRTSLSKLKSTNEITIKSTKKYSLIKVNNYDLYQQINQQTNQQLTNNQPTTNHKQECKELKNEKKKRNKQTSDEVLSNSDSTTIRKEFKSFVEEYKNKSNRNVRAYEKYYAKYKVRRKIFNNTDLSRALDIMLNDSFLQGENSSGKVYGDLEYLLRNDSVVEKLLNNAEAKERAEESVKTFKVNGKEVSKEEYIRYFKVNNLLHPKYNPNPLKNDK